MNFLWNLIEQFVDVRATKYRGQLDLSDGFVGVLRLFSTRGFRKYELESHKGFRLVRSAQRLIVIHPMDGVFLREAGESE
jgi:hypothetical protein